MKLLRCFYQAFWKHLGDWGLTPRQFFLIQAAIVTVLLLARCLARAADMPAQDQLMVNLIGLTIAVLDLGAFGITVFPKTVRSCYTIVSFRCWFKFLPPTTAGERKLLQSRIDAELRERAQTLDGMYQTEDHIQAALAERKFSEKGRELLLKGMEVGKKAARWMFYHPRNLAGSPYLPYRFAVHASYKQYLQGVAV